MRDLAYDICKVVAITALVVTVCNTKLMLIEEGKEFRKHQQISYEAIMVLQKTCAQLILEHKNLASSTEDVLKNHSIGFAKMQNTLNSLTINPRYRFEPNEKR